MRYKNIVARTIPLLLTVLLSTSALARGIDIENIKIFAGKPLIEEMNIAFNLKVDSDARYPSNPIMLAYQNTFVFSPRQLRWYAYGSNGRVVNSGRASGGSSYCRDIKRPCRTPSGSYRVISKGGPGCRSARYPLPRGGAPMPYCMFYSGYYAIHGSYSVPNYNASHGCIRVHPSAARWLSANFIRHGTRVVVLPY